MLGGVLDQRKGAPPESGHQQQQQNPDGVHRHDGYPNKGASGLGYFAYPGYKAEGKRQKAKGDYRLPMLQHS
ncbi:hypothetical protein DC3_46810 [Deinococcus cellulosilyticus NBRC 106333 = KACC 11606]|uniref:Uncharacterized protein n=1 Tax=Deinococcus cellulosilyticus (strain DSM 18568 / NBRC 106333 / KACC 11606 / 5516J-15) TaxID=1223518 RepID=A0A511N978_DEIC1|nr:hypothetical protein DC3_46810 [Deinococcus cellulosilyticus NBRC 106333 = KACC 11606]